MFIVQQLERTIFCFPPTLSLPFLTCSGMHSHDIYSVSKYNINRIMLAHKLHVLCSYHLSYMYVLYICNVHVINCVYMHMCVCLIHVLLLVKMGTCSLFFISFLRRTSVWREIMLLGNDTRLGNGYCLSF